MRFHTYSKFSPESADTVDLQALLDNLADFLLQSGFAGGGPSNPWGEPEEPEGDRSLDALRQAILDALIQSGQFTPEMLEALRGDGDELSEAKLSEVTGGEHRAAHADGRANVWRADEVGASTGQEQFLSNAPAHEAGYVKVPPIIE